MRGAVVLAVAVWAAGCGNVMVVAPPPVFPAQTQWRVELPAAPLGELASDGRRLFVRTEDGFLRAYALASGRELWSRSVGPAALAAGESVWLLDPEGALEALDPASGEPRWRVETGVASALAPTPDGTSILIAGAGAALLDGADGRMRWRVPGGPQAVTSPTAAGPCVAIGEVDGTLRCRDRATGAGVWAVSLGSDLRARPVADERGRLYLGSGDRSIVALRQDKAGRQDWSWRVGAAVPWSGALLGERFLVATLGNVIYSLDRRNGNMQWRASLPSRPLGAPMTLGSAVLVPCHESEVVVFDAADGRTMGSLHAPSALAAAPLLVGERLVVPVRNPWAIIGMQLALADDGDLAPTPTRR